MFHFQTLEHSEPSKLEDLQDLRFKIQDPSSKFKEAYNICEDNSGLKMLGSPDFEVCCPKSQSVQLRINITENLHIPVGDLSF